MTTTNPLIGPNLFSGSIPNVVPFSIRETPGLIALVEGMREWLNNQLVPFVNENINKLSADWVALSEALIDKVNEIAAGVQADVDQAEAARIAAEAARDLAEMYAEMAGTASDGAMTEVFDNLSSEFRTALNAIYADKATQETVETGRLSDATLNARFDAKASVDDLTSAINAEVDNRNTAINNKATEITGLISDETEARINADLGKRDIAAEVQAEDTSFDALADTGVYSFPAVPTHVSAPVSSKGVLISENHGTLTIQRYYSEGEVYIRTAENGAFNSWNRVPHGQGMVPRGKIVFIGDSYMAGLGLASPAVQRWPYLMSQALNATEVNLSNSGSGYVNNGSAGNFVAQSLNVPNDANTVIICGGINDAPTAPSQATITSAVNSIVNNIRSNAPGARIIFISPMWFHNQVTAELMAIDDKVRNAVANIKNVRYIENAMWLRVDRNELAQGDGHPNLAGSEVIKTWVMDNILEKPGTGAIQGKFISPASGDATLTGPSTNMIADGTIYNARAGWWRISGEIILYKVCLGFMVLRAGAYTDEMRNDVISESNPTVKNTFIDYYHPGGNLYIGVGYRPNASSTTTLTGLKKNRVTAQWMHR